jgi:hypothetical protein
MIQKPQPNRVAIPGRLLVFEIAFLLRTASVWRPPGGLPDLVSRRGATLWSALAVQKSGGSTFCHCPDPVVSFAPPGTPFWFCWHFASDAPKARYRLAVAAPSRDRAADDPAMNQQVLSGGRRSRLTFRLLSAANVTVLGHRFGQA